MRVLRTKYKWYNCRDMFDRVCIGNKLRDCFISGGLSTKNCLESGMLFQMTAIR